MFGEGLNSDLWEQTSEVGLDFGADGLTGVPWRGPGRKCNGSCCKTILCGFVQRGLEIGVVVMKKAVVMIPRAALPSVDERGGVVSREKKVVCVTRDQGCGLLAS